uniref:Uncharacterized protein n=2 Tax=Candidatus Kentrum sp. SD TaxID=2126332 RepID=A0A451BSH1_9GAMM|nr:MAG: hypothetical protein BECKSD772D_GA0070982_12761 [Candidatus Kentron sp. SD]
MKIRLQSRSVRGTGHDERNRRSRSSECARPLPFGTPFTYAINETTDRTLGASQLTGLLDAGTDVVLQASNDITVSNPITVNNGSGDGGHLTLQAGRSLLLDANVTTDNGNNLTLIANDANANGVAAAQRDAGAAVITMADGVAIDAGTGNVLMELRDGAGRTGAAAQSGDITLRAISARTITAVNADPTAGSGIILESDALTANATTGDGIVLAGDDFTNNAGSSALAVGSGSRWLVWSGNPANDTRSGLAYDFDQYNATYGATTPVASTGNGFLYTLAPSACPPTSSLRDRTREIIASIPR